MESIRDIDTNLLEIMAIEELRINSTEITNHYLGKIAVRCNKAI